MTWEFEHFDHRELIPNLKLPDKNDFDLMQLREKEDEDE